MKRISLLKIFCIVVVLSFLSIPALALSKSDLMTYYSSIPLSPSVFAGDTQNAGVIMPTSHTFQDDDLSLWNWVNPAPKPATPSTSIVKPAISPGLGGINKSASTGYFPEANPQGVSKVNPGRPMCGPVHYVNATTEERNGEDIINPRTGEPYPIITDIRGNAYIVRGGCG